jgi:hypothetical protein
LRCVDGVSRTTMRRGVYDGVAVASMWRLAREFTGESGRGRAVGLLRLTARPGRVRGSPREDSKNYNVRLRTSFRETLFRVGKAMACIPTLPTAMERVVSSQTIMPPLNHSSNPKSNANAHGSTARRMQAALDLPLYQCPILASDLGYHHLITTT